MKIKRLALVGIGLIGGSLAAALRERGVVGEVVASARRQETLDTAKYLGLIDAGDIDVAKAVDGADMIVLAVPMGAYPEILAALKPVWRDDVVVTDAGSTKQSFLRDAEAVFGSLPQNLVPAHPVAGTERSGPAAAIPDLFRHRRVIVTPHDASAEPAIQRVEDMWRTTGAQVTRMSAAHHDEVLALTSHLPHVIAYQLIETLARAEDTREIFAYAAGGLKDLTRIASSNPQMWADIMAANKTDVLAALDNYLNDLESLRQLIASDDLAALRQHFERAKSARDRWIHTAEAG